MMLIFAIFFQIDSALYYLEEGTYLQNINMLFKAESLLVEETEGVCNCTTYYYLSESSYRILNYYYVAGKKERAKEYLNKSIERVKKSIDIAVDYSDAHALLGTLYGMKIVLDDNPLAGMIYGPKSKKELEKAVELDPDNPWAHLRLGIRYLHTPQKWGGDKQKALVEFLKAVELSPEVAEFYVWLGIAYKENNNVNSAIRVMKKALEIEPSYKWAKMELKKIKE